MSQKWDRIDTNLKQQITLMAPRRDDRLALPALGEWYDDLLTIDAWINNRSKPQQGQNLLYAKLQEREPRIFERLKYLAEKRGISPEEMRLQILAGKAQRLSVEEVTDISEEEAEQ